jgi:hypothetical protein
MHGSVEGTCNTLLILPGVRRREKHGVLRILAHRASFGSVPRSLIADVDCSNCGPRIAPVMNVTKM